MINRTLQVCVLLC